MYKISQCLTHHLGFSFWTIWWSTLDIKGADEAIVILVNDTSFIWEGSGVGVSFAGSMECAQHPEGLAMSMVLVSWVSLPIMPCYGV